MYFAGTPGPERWPKWAMSSAILLQKQELQRVFSATYGFFSAIFSFALLLLLKHLHFCCQLITKHQFLLQNSVVTEKIIFSIEITFYIWLSNNCIKPKLRTVLRSWRHSAVIEHIHSMYEDLGSISRTKTNNISGFLWGGKIGTPCRVHRTRTYISTLVCLV